MVARVFVATVALVALVTLARVSSAQCGGICLYEVGSPDNSMSAAGASARADDAATALFNIAGTTRLEGTHVLTATVLGFVDQEFNVNSGKTQPANAGNSGGQLGSFLPLGSAFISIQPWDKQSPYLENVRLAFSFAGLYGGALDYDNDWAGRTWITETSMIGLNLAPGLAYAFDSSIGKLSVGAAVNALFLKLDYQSKLGLNDASPTNEIDDADDWTVAGTVALMYEPTEETRFGLNYRSPAKVNLHGDFDSLLPTGKFDSKFDLAQGLNVGVYHRLTSKFALLGDLGWTDWSTFDYQGFTAPMINMPIHRNFHDTWRLGVGAQFHPGDTWTFSGGFSYDSSPVDAKDRLPDMPVSEQFRFSAGLQRQAADNITLGVGYTFLWAANNEIDKVRVSIDPQPEVILDGHYDPSFIHFFSVSLGVKFRSLLGYT